MDERIKYNPETMKVKICKECHGLGIVHNMDGDILVCPNCLGRGRLIEIKTTNEVTLNSVNYGQDIVNGQLRIEDAAGGDHDGN